MIPRSLGEPPSISISVSSHFNDWLIETDLSLGFTTYQTNRLFFVSGQTSGRVKLHERLFDRPMGLYHTEQSLYLSTRSQLWRFYNALEPGKQYRNSDQLYIPHTGHTTGDLNTHEVVVDRNGQIIFVNTDFSCLATLSPEYSFVPLWQPPFISTLVSEDRCHLNGVALVDGTAKYVSACSATDVPAGWRPYRANGGIVMDIDTNEIIGAGLSMPHSPRWYRGKLWLLNSGSGELGYLQDGQFTPLVFCPGFVRGLAFWEEFAFVGLSQLRSSSFTGLALEERLAADQQQAQCGVMVVDLKRGDTVHWLHFGQTIEELFDIVVLPQVRQPQALGFQGDEIERIVTFPGSGGLVSTKPSLKLAGQRVPLAGLPRTEQGRVPVKYQRVYNLTASNALAYEAMTYPPLSRQWQQRPSRGDLLGISASINETMVGFAIAEGVGSAHAELISLKVLPECRRQGIGTQLVRQLEQELRQQGSASLSVVYQVTDLTRLALEPLLRQLNWPPSERKGPWRRTRKVWAERPPGSVPEPSSPDAMSL